MNSNKSELKNDLNRNEADLNYWKELCSELTKDKNDVIEEFAEFENASKQIEKELELTIAQLEASNRKLQQKESSLQIDNANFKEKLEQSQQEIASLQSMLNAANDENKRLTTLVRELEQRNDDLERTERMIMESVAIKESMLNVAIEKNAILELEVDEKDSLQEKFQRLMDEANELRQEIAINQKRSDAQHTNNNNTSSNSSTISNSNVHKRCDNIRETPLETSNRFLALNIVGDLLKKIGKKKELELKHDQVLGDYVVLPPALSMSLRLKSKMKRPRRDNSMFDSDSDKFLESKLNVYRQNSKDSKTSNGSTLSMKISK